MRSVLPAVLAVVLLLPGVAAAQSSPFQPLPQAPTQTAAPAASDSPDDGGGVTGLQQALLIAAGVVLVVGIGVAIARDARAQAPVTERELRRAEEGASADHERPRADPKAKAASKRARQARKRNRPVRK